MTGPGLRVEVIAHKTLMVVRPTGWVTRRNYFQLDAKIRQLADRGGHVIVDLSSAHLVDSAALDVFLFYKNRMEREGGCLVLACLSQTVQRMLFDTGLHGKLNVCTTVAEGMGFAGREVDSGKVPSIVEWGSGSANAKGDGVERDSCVREG